MVRYLIGFYAAPYRNARTLSGRSHSTVNTHEHLGVHLNNTTLAGVEWVLWLAIESHIGYGTLGSNNSRTKLTPSGKPSPINVAERSSQVAMAGAHRSEYRWTLGSQNNILEWRHRIGKRSVGRQPTKLTDDVKRAAGNRRPSNVGFGSVEL
ncbi:jg4919 [Pararge aegeria aegeria]|uniref:Jg4919 protein n=1 Tax=Pararge aegeria aegeria TaxID=348720 RepID=A0A8S4SKX9_9NEOP|nr:jg4919 [Pararge aegeria aegeria]